MTEAEWLACDDPSTAMRYLRGKISERKLRLCVVATLRACAARIDLPNTLNILLVAERHADQPSEELQSVSSPLYLSISVETGPRVMALLAAVQSAQGYGYMPNMNSWRALQALAAPELMAHLREVVGNPFHETHFERVWTTDTAKTLARGMYDSREFGAMPILADALQDAGCESEDILAHCRDPHAAHVRGCWVCDLVLGKA